MSTSTLADPIRSAFINRGAAVLKEMAAALDARALAKALEAPEGVGMLARAVLLAPPPASTPRPAVLRARLRGIEARDAMLDRLGPWMTGEAAAERLGVSIDGVNRRRQRGGLLSAVFRRGDVRYPRFQFEGGHVSPTVRQVLKILAAEDSMFLLAFFAAPRAELNGLTPKAAIEGGRGREVEGLAKAAAAPHG
jgi:hypothetical protein